MIWPFQRPEVRILVVCKANVCRSPAAEALLRHHFRQCGLQRRVVVRSAGTAVGASGVPPDPRMVAIATEIGVSMRGQRSRMLSQAMVEASSHVWVMEREHVDEVLRIEPGAASKISLIDPHDGDVPDPYFGSTFRVRTVFERLCGIACLRTKQIAEDLAPLLV